MHEPIGLDYVIHRQVQYIQVIDRCGEKHLPMIKEMKDFHSISQHQEHTMSINRVVHRLKQIGELPLRHSDEDFQEFFQQIICSKISYMGMMIIMENE